MPVTCWGYVGVAGVLPHLHEHPVLLGVVAIVIIFYGNGAGIAAHRGDPHHNVISIYFAGAVPAAGLGMGAVVPLALNEAICSAV